MEEHFEGWMDRSYFKKKSKPGWVFSTDQLIASVQTKVFKFKSWIKIRRACQTGAKIFFFSFNPVALNPTFRMLKCCLFLN